MKVLLKLVSIPILLCCIDFLFRLELIQRYSEAQLLFYCCSMLISISYFILLILILKSISQIKWIFYTLLIIGLGTILISFAASLGFYSLNGLFPNYYTLLYFKTEPKSVFIILRDVIKIKDLLISTLSLGIILTFFSWYIKQHVPQVKKKYLLFFFIFQFSGFQSLVYFHKKFDQCAIVDVNFMACVQRHLFKWDDYSEFTGKGLEERKKADIPLKLDKKKFNVIVVIFESFRKRSAQIYGADKATTPKLVEFSKENTESFYCFQQPVSVSSTTMLAVPAILTGIGPYQDKSILYTQPLLWEYAQIFGYKTFFISSHTLKWYKFNQFYKKEKLDYWWNKDNSGLPYYNDLGVNDENTISELTKTISKCSPKSFFGVVQLNATHFPYKVPKKHQKWKETYSDTYNNAIRYQDELIGKFLNHLKKEDLLRNTVILFVSDHGESLLEHKGIGHIESNYTETISIPLMAYFPKGILSKNDEKTMRKNLKELTSNIDIAPTIIDLLGLENHPEIQHYAKNFSGYSLLKSIPENRSVISLNNNQIANFNTGLSIASKNFHYLYRTNIVPNKEEYYYWRKDINESNDISNQLTIQKRKKLMDVISKYPVCDNLRKKIVKLK